MNKVLLVEDNEVQRQMLAMILAKKQYIVSAVSDPNEAKDATRAELIPGTKILRYRQVEYHPYGVVKLEQELYFDGMQGKVVPARLVKLTTAEMKAVRQEYDKRVKAEEARLIALSREEAATPDLPKWRRHAVVGVTGWSGHPGPVGDDGKRRS